MEMMYGMCKKEHLLWRCSYDCTDLMIYYWDEDICQSSNGVRTQLFESDFEIGEEILED